MIPKNVYYTHVNKNTKKKFLKTISFNKKNNPTLNFIFYDDEKSRRFIEKYYPKFYKFYENIHPDYGAVKADIFRVLILYKYGGIYIDIKTKIINIYELIKNKEFCIATYDDTLMYLYNNIISTHASNFFISTIKKGKIITAIKNEMFHRLKNFGKINIPISLKIFLPGNNVSGMSSVFFYTGPHLFTSIYKKYPNIKLIRNNKYIIYDNESEVIDRIFNAKKVYKNRYHISKKQIFLPKNLNIKDIKKFNKKYRFNKIIFKLGLIFICIFIIYRYKQVLGTNYLK